MGLYRSLEFAVNDLDFTRIATETKTFTAAYAAIIARSGDKVC